MDLVLSNGFCEMTTIEMDEINGGSIGAALVGICAGAIGIIGGPPAAITGTVAVGCWYLGSTLIAVGGVLSGVGY